MLSGSETSRNKKSESFLLNNCWALAPGPFASAQGDGGRAQGDGGSAQGDGGRALRVTMEKLRNDSFSSTIRGYKSHRIFTLQSENLLLYL